MRRLLIASLATLAGLAQAQTVIVRTNEIAGNVFQSENLVGLAGTWRVTLYSVDGGEPFAIAPSNAEMRVIDLADNRTVSYSVVRGADSNTLRGEAIISSRTDPTMAAIPFHLKFVRRSDQVPLYWASIRVTNAPASGGSVAVTNLFSPSTTNYWDIGLTNLISVTNTISVGNTSVSNTIINTITNYVDATVTVPGLTVTVSQITVPINRLTAIGEVSGLVATTQGDGSVAWMDRAGRLDAFDGTNALASVSGIRVGSGLRGTIGGDGALEIDIIGSGLPPMPPGTALTNITIYTYQPGSRTGVWVQASAGATQWMIIARGAAGGQSLVVGQYSVGGTSRMIASVRPLGWYYVEVGERGADGYSIATNNIAAYNTNSRAYPCGGRGAARTSAFGANGGGRSAVWDGAPMLGTPSNLIIVAGGGGGLAGSTSAARPEYANGGGTAGRPGGNLSSELGLAVVYGGTQTAAMNAIEWSSSIITGVYAGLLQGGDAQMTTNAAASGASTVGGGGDGFYGGAGAAIIASGSARGHGAGGSGYINTAYGYGYTIRSVLQYHALDDNPMLLEQYNITPPDDRDGFVVIAEVVTL